MPPHRLLLRHDDIVETIAFYVATDEFLGPPGGIAPLILAWRRFAMLLAYPTNPGFYARIFHAKFDSAAPIRRYGRKRINTAALADELTRRFNTMYRMRLIVRSKSFWVCEEGSILRDMWTIYLMCIESDGNNRRQLFEYAQLQDYIELYRTSVLGPLRARSGLPQITTERSLALWLWWFATTPG